MVAVCCARWVAASAYCSRIVYRAKDKWSGSVASRVEVGVAVVCRGTGDGGGDY
jgi:hypothetical protein